MQIKIRNWDRFQHYDPKKRTPPWIKLHRQLLENRQWHALTGDASKLLVECWIIASESADGTIDCEVEDLAFRLRKDPSKTALLLQEIESVGLIEVTGKNASAVLARRQRDATPEAEAETEAEEEQKNRTSSDELGESPEMETSDDGPHQDEPPDPPKAEPSKAEINATLAPLIREKLWLTDSSKAPAALGKDSEGRPWSMGRELSIAKNLLKECSLEELAGAIGICRVLLEFEPYEPLSLRLFNVANRADRLRDCVGYWRKIQAQHNRGRVRPISDFLKAANG